MDSAHARLSLPGRHQTECVLIFVSSVNTFGKDLTNQRKLFAASSPCSLLSYRSGKNGLQLTPNLCPFSFKKMSLKTAVPQGSQRVQWMPGVRDLWMIGIDFAHADTRSLRGHNYFTAWLYLAELATGRGKAKALWGLEEQIWGWGRFPHRPALPPQQENCWRNNGDRTVFIQNHCLCGLGISGQYEDLGGSQALPVDSLPAATVGGATLFCLDTWLGGCVMCSTEFVILLVFESFMGHLSKHSVEMTCLHNPGLCLVFILHLALRKSGIFFKDSF